MCPDVPFWCARSHLLLWPIIPVDVPNCAFWMRQGVRFNGIIVPFLLGNLYPFNGSHCTFCVWPIMLFRCAHLYLPTYWIAFFCCVAVSYLFGFPRCTFDGPYCIFSVCSILVFSVPCCSSLCALLYLAHVLSCTCSMCVCIFPMHLIVQFRYIQLYRFDVSHCICCTVLCHVDVSNCTFLVFCALPFQGFGDDLVLTTAFPKRELAAADATCHSCSLASLGLAPSTRLVATDTAALAAEKVQHANLCVTR